MLRRPDPSRSGIAIRSCEGTVRPGWLPGDAWVVSGRVTHGGARRPVAVAMSPTDWRNGLAQLRRRAQLTLRQTQRPRTRAALLDGRRPAGLGACFEARRPGWTVDRGGGDQSAVVDNRARYVVAETADTRLRLAGPRHAPPAVDLALPGLTLLDNVSRRPAGCTVLQRY